MSGIKITAFIMYATRRGGGGRQKSLVGGVFKCFEGKSGDGKNFWRQGGGILIDF